MSARTMSCITVILGMVLMGCGKSSKDNSTGGAAGAKAGSPEHAVKVVQQAAANHNWGQYYDGMTEKAQKNTALGLMFALAPVMKAGPDWKAKVQSLQDRHGLGEEAEKNRKRSTNPDEDFDIVAGMIKDRKGFVSESLDILVEYSSNKVGPFLFQGDLSDVNVNGDVATGNMKTKIGEQEKTQSVSFKKVDGYWLLDK